MFPSYLIDEGVRNKNSKLDQEIQDIKHEKYQRTQEEIHDAFHSWMKFVSKYTESHNSDSISKHEFITINNLKFKKGSKDYYDSRKSKKRIIFSFSRKDRVELILTKYRGWPNIGKADVYHFFLKIKNKTILDLSLAYTDEFNYRNSKKDIIYTYELKYYDPDYSYYYQKIINLISALYEKENYEKEQKKDSLLAEEEIDREFPNIKL